MKCIVTSRLGKVHTLTRFFHRAHSFLSPYRAPELLFGPQSYDARATDLWSLGSFIAQFYTPVILTKRSLYGNDSDEEEDDGDLDNIEPINGFIISPSTDTRSILSDNAMWDRRTLFDATRGSIGLAWSIFKIFGTPSNENWPVSG